MTEQSAASASPPSTVVTVVAWLALLWSGLAAVMGVFQIIFVSFMPRPPMMTDAEAAQVPAVIRFVFNHMMETVIGFTFLWLAVFACSLGLLWRLTWARRAFMALLAFGAVTTIAMWLLQQMTMNTMLGMGGASVDADFRNMMTLMRIMTAVLALALAIPMTWLVFYLRKPDVRAEFR